MIFDLNEVLNVTSIGTGFIGFAGFIYVGVYRAANLELKVNTMWDYIMRRAIQDGVNNGVLKRNSPISLTPEIEKLYSQQFRADISDFYTPEKQKLSDRDLFVAFESKFGNQFLEKICLPHSIPTGVCVLAGIKIAKDNLLRKENAEKGLENFTS